MKRRLALGLLVALALAAGLWFAGRGAPRAPEIPVPAAEVPGPTRAPAAETVAEPATAREELHGAAPKPETAASSISLTLRFVDPGGTALRPEFARVRLSNSDGHWVEALSNGSDSVRFERIAGSRQVARVEAQGFTHRPQEFDLSGRSPAEGGLSESLILWSMYWVAVVVQAEDGRPLRTLAEALGIEPKCLFVDAFSARVLTEDPGGAATAFLKPPTYQQWEMGESVVGSLVLAEPPPFWVALDFHGQLVDKQRLEPRATEVVFRLRLASLEAVLASLRLRVFEAQGDAPVAGARVTLRADTSAHRRTDQGDVPTREDGSVEFGRIVPGRYELTVQRGDALYQDRIELAAGEARDLGIVRIGGSTPLRIRVVDERGEAQQAWLEIAPFEMGKSASDLYPPMLHVVTGHDGTGKLPMPARVSIVRAQQITPRGLAPNGRMSASVRIDPAFPPGDAVTLVILDQAHVRISCKVPEARKLQLIDGSGLIVLEKPPDSEFEIGRGRYELRLLGAEDVILYQRSIVLRAGDQELELP